MAMFPTDVDFNALAINEVVSSTEDDATVEIGRSIKFNYDTNSFEVIGGVLTEPSKVDSIKQWIELFIRTELNKYAIYDDNFGIDLKDLIGYRLPRGYQVAEIMRRINTGILEGCPNVVSVTNWDFSKGSFSFKVTTNTGEEVTISE